MSQKRRLHSVEALSCASWSTVARSASPRRGFTSGASGARGRTVRSPDHLFICSRIGASPDAPTAQRHQHHRPDSTPSDRPRRGRPTGPARRRQTVEELGRSTPRRSVACPGCASFDRIPGIRTRRERARWASPRRSWSCPAPRPTRRSSAGTAGLKGMSLDRADSGRSLSGSSSR